MPIYITVFGKTRKYEVFCRKFANTRLTKELMAFFAPAESLPTPATLPQCSLIGGDRSHLATSSCLCQHRPTSNNETWLDQRVENERQRPERRQLHSQ